MLRAFPLEPKNPAIGLLVFHPKHAFSLPYGLPKLVVGRFFDLDWQLALKMHGFSINKPPVLYSRECTSYFMKFLDPSISRNHHMKHHMKHHRMPRHSTLATPNSWNRPSPPRHVAPWPSAARPTMGRPSPCPCCSCWPACPVRWSLLLGPSLGPYKINVFFFFLIMVCAKQKQQG